MKNTQSPAPGVAAEVEAKVRQITDAALKALSADDHYAASAMREFEAVVRAALQASAAAVEPAYYQHFHNGEWFNCSKSYYDHLRQSNGYEVRKLYTAPPLPAQVQEAKVTRIELETDAYLEQSGPLSMWALYRGGEFIRHLHRFEREFVNCALASRTPALGMDKLVSKIWLDDMADDAEPVEITVHGDEKNLKRLQAFLESPRFKAAPGMAGGVGAEVEKQLKWAKTGLHLVRNKLVSMGVKVDDTALFNLRAVEDSIDAALSAPHPSPAPQAAGAWQPMDTAKEQEGLLTIWIDWQNGTTEMWNDCYYDQICDEWRTSRPSGHLRCVPARFVTNWIKIAPPAIEAGRAGS